MDTFHTSFPQVYTVYSLKELVLTLPGGGGGGGVGGGGSQQSFIVGRSASRSNPLTFYFPVIHVSEDIIKFSRSKTRPGFCNKRYPCRMPSTA